MINSNNEDVYVYKSPSGSVYTQPLALALLTETFFAKSEAWNSQSAKSVARSWVWSQELNGQMGSFSCQELVMGTCQN